MSVKVTRHLQFRLFMGKLTPVKNGKMKRSKEMYPVTRSNMKHKTKRRLANINQLKQ